MLDVIHDAQIREHGGTAGIRDEGLLESALARPQQKWAYAAKPDVATLAVCAMAATLAASLQAPITSILLVVEMSGRVEHTLPVAACVLLALLTADLLRGRPIYDVLLHRFLAAGEPALPYDEDAVLELPVEMGSEAAGRRIASLDLPVGARIVRLRRGLSAYAPTGRTVLLPGDYVQVVVERETADGGADAGTRARLRVLFRHDESTVPVRPR